ncbi:prepilin-type N-terminal cleavage/methylation domain-containing protein [Opitutaceae bacterium TAV1]|nr:prepilin-type N-terminal cleavage/methylation domain-containing protein [Opitutaceae bacterium TAV1]
MNPTSSLDRAPARPLFPRHVHAIHPARAFTLVELLTVIAIIGILAAILIPVVGKVRASARETQGLSNIRQVGLGCILYAQDNRGIFPCYYERPDGDHSWAESVLRLLSGQEVKPGVLSGVFSDPSVGIGKNQLQWGANPLLMPDNSSTLDWRDRLNARLDNIGRASEVVVLADAQVHASSGYATAALTKLGGSWAACAASPYSYKPGNPITPNDAPVGADSSVLGDIAWRARGNTAAKVVFVDGHARIVEKNKLFGRNFYPVN